MANLACRPRHEFCAPSLSCRRHTRSDRHDRHLHSKHDAMQTTFQRARYCRRGVRHQNRTGNVPRDCQVIVAFRLQYRDARSNFLDNCMIERKPIADQSVAKVFDYLSPHTFARGVDAWHCVLPCFALRLAVIQPQQGLRRIPSSIHSIVYHRRESS